MEVSTERFIESFNFTVTFAISEYRWRWFLYDRYGSATYSHPSVDHNLRSNDRVVALYPFNMTTLLVFKERSVLAVENLYGDLSTTRLTEITREFGCVSQSSIAGTGSDVIFLSQRGIISLRQTEFGISQSD